jgi:hypothetical protein
MALKYTKLSIPRPSKMTSDIFGMQEYHVATLTK